MYHIAVRYFRALRNVKSSRRPAIPADSDKDRHQEIPWKLRTSLPQTPSRIPIFATLLSTMATSRDAPNPLRPYYIPPSIGLPPDLPQNQTAPAPSYSPPSNKPSFGSQARDILSDLDYDSYFTESPSWAEHARRVVDQALWNYTSVLLAQPFEVAKTILQIHQASGQTPGLAVKEEARSRSRPNSYASGKFEDVCTHSADIR